MDEENQLGTLDEREKARARPIDGPYKDYAIAVRHLLGYFPEDNRAFLTSRMAHGKTGVSNVTITTMARGFRANAYNTRRVAEALGGNPSELLRLGGFLDAEPIAEERSASIDRFIKVIDEIAGDLKTDVNDFDYDYWNHLVFKEKYGIGERLGQRVDLIDRSNKVDEIKALLWNIARTPEAYGLMPDRILNLLSGRGDVAFPNSLSIPSDANSQINQEEEEASDFDSPAKSKRSYLEKFGSIRRFNINSSLRKKLRESGQFYDQVPIELEYGRGDWVWERFGIPTMHGLMRRSDSEYREMVLRAYLIAFLSRNEQVLRIDEKYKGLLLLCFDYGILRDEWAVTSTKDVKIDILYERLSSLRHRIITESYQYELAIVGWYEGRRNPENALQTVMNLLELLNINLSGKRSSLATFMPNTTDESKHATIEFLRLLDDEWSRVWTAQNIPGLYLPSFQNALEHNDFNADFLCFMCFGYYASIRREIARSSNIDALENIDVYTFSLCSAFAEWWKSTPFNPQLSLFTVYDSAESRQTSPSLPEQGELKAA